MKGGSGNLGGFPPLLGATGAPSGLEGVEFMNDRGLVAIIFCRWHDAVFDARHGHRGRAGGNAIWLKSSLPHIGPEPA